jgi:hypothetical protein
MYKISKLSPVARAVGVIGATAALVTGVTFANLTSNTVALSPNTLDSASAQLAIGLTNTGTCADRNLGPRQGITATLIPGVASAPYEFCLANTGEVDLGLTVSIPQAALAGSQISPSLVNLSIVCDNGGTSSGALDQYTGGTPLGSLTASGGANDNTDCEATVTLSGSYTGSGNETVNSFSINFDGSQLAI